MIVALTSAMLIWINGSPRSWAADAPADQNEKVDEDEKLDEAVAVGATIIMLDIPTSNGIVKTAIVVNDKKDLRSLEALFPKYSTFPKSSIAGAWMPKYKVYFDFPNRKSMSILVSDHGMDGALWSTGEGDHEVQGNLDEFVKELQKRGNARR